MKQNVYKWMMASAVCLSLASSLGQVSAAAEKYPSKPITMYINFGAGGSTDLSARALARAAENNLGVSIVPVNKPGAGGVTGVTELKNAPKNGETIGIITFASVAIIPNQTKVSYTPDDFESIIAYGQYNYCIAVKADSPIKTIEDLSKAAKAKPGGLSFSASGYPQPFAANKIGEKDGVKFRYVNFKSGAEAITAVLGEHVDFGVIIVSDLPPFLKSGELRVLAAAGDTRMPEAPDAPTLKELGYDISIVSWLGLGVPAGIGKDKLDVLREVFQKAASDPEFLDAMKKLNLLPDRMSGDEFQKKLSDGYKEIGEYFKQIGYEK